MRFDNTRHPLYCGIDLHARAMSVCILTQAGETLRHRHRQTTPAALLTVMAPYRPAIVVAVACMFTWDWLADLCAEAAIPFGLGHALSMQAIHGGKATHDQSDAHTMAVLLRGGLLPQAYVSPAARRATRALLRRRMPLAHKRGARLAHVHHTTRQDHVPALGTNLAYQANRDGVAARCADPAGPTSMEGDLALIAYEDALRRDVERTIVPTATQHDAHTLALRQTVPGIGTRLSLVLRDDIPPIARVPRGQEWASSCRLGTWAKASHGKRSGTAGANMGKAHRTWTFSAAAVFCRRAHPAGQTCLASLEQKHAQGKA